MIAEASSEADDETRSELQNGGREAALAWRCPRVCRSSEPLDEDHREALGAIAALTGHQFKTCPLSRAWEPWVHTAVDAEDAGIAEYRAAYGAPPRTLVQAVSVIKRARRARDAEEARIAREKHK